MHGHVICYITYYCHLYHVIHHLPSIHWYIYHMIPHLVLKRSITFYVMFPFRKLSIYSPASR